MNDFQRKQVQQLIEWDKMILEQSLHWWTLWGLLLWKEKRYSKENWEVVNNWLVN